MFAGKEGISSTTGVDFFFPSDDDDVYLDKLQTRGLKKSILYM
jgi:hypothetical protein